MVRLAILASGTGTNAEAIIRYIQGVQDVEITCIVSNKSKAGVLERARLYGIPTRVFKPKSWKNNPEDILTYFRENKIDGIVLAGYLQKIPEYLIREFPDRIVNIHPALLPAYGGHGMYGMHVHEAVHANREKESGITIHLVNENYDEGEIIFQARCMLEPDDTPEDIRNRVLELEHRYFPAVVKYFAKGQAKRIETGQSPATAEGR